MMFLAALRIRRSGPAPDPTPGLTGPRTLAVFLTLALPLWLGLAHDAQAQDAGCLPPGWLEELAALSAGGSQVATGPSGQQPPARVQVWMDGSVSMRGFLNGERPGIETPIYDIAQRLPDVLPRESRATYRVFGSRLGREIGPEGLANATRSSFYRDRSVNQSSQPWLVLEAAAREKDAVTLLISDLFLDDGADKGTTSAFRDPISALAKRGWAVGLLGVLSRFTGTVYDLPNLGSVRMNNGAMPLYIMVAGPPAQVAWVLNALETRLLASYSRPLPDGRFRLKTALFGGPQPQARTATTADATFVDLPHAEGLRVDQPMRGVEGAEVLAPALSHGLRRVMISQRLRKTAEQPLIARLPFSALGGGTLAQPQVRMWGRATRSPDGSCRPDSWYVGQPPPGLIGPPRIGSDGQTLEVPLFSPRDRTIRQLRPNALFLARIVLPRAATDGAGASQHAGRGWLNQWSFGPMEAPKIAATARAGGLIHTLNLARLASELAWLENRPSADQPPPPPAAILDIAFSVYD